VPKSPELPVTVIVYVPGVAVLLIVKVCVDKMPLEMGLVAQLTGELATIVPVIVHEVSAVLKLIPVTETLVPVGPVVGLSVIVGPTTMNEALAWSPTFVAMTVIV
jgi:hypothetical protein